MQASGSHFLSFSFHFLTSQATFEDDNSEDEWLEPLPPGSRRPLGKGFKASWGVSWFSRRYLLSSMVSLNTRLDPFESL